MTDPADRGVLAAVTAARHLPWLRHPVRAARTWWHLHTFHHYAVGRLRGSKVPVGVIAWVHDGSTAAEDRSGICPGSEPASAHPEKFPWQTPAENALLRLAETVAAGVDLAVVVEVLDWYRDPLRPAEAIPGWVREHLPVVPTTTELWEANEGVAGADPEWALGRLLAALAAANDDFDDPSPGAVEGTDPARDYLGYLWAGHRRPAHVLVANRVPLRLGLRMNPETFQAWRWRHLAVAAAGDPTLTEGLLSLVDDPDMVWADIGDVVTWAREVGPEHALLYARCGFALEEGLACDADLDALRVMASLRGPVPFPTGT